MYKKFGFLLIVLSLICFGLFGYLFFIEKDFFVKGFQDKLIIEVNSDYLDSSPNVCYGSLFKCKKLTGVIEGEVDSSVIGEYPIVYKYQYNDKEYVINRNVLVVDSKNPVISISGKTKICPNGKIIEKKYAAFDNYDGDLTDKVNFVESDGKHYLEVFDSSNNLAKVEADVSIVDDSPSISLIGASKVYLLVGNKYNELGAKASDACDGDLTKNVTIKNNINNKKVGTYQVTYSVKDSAGNQKSIVRQVVVIKKNAVINPTKKTIYLTFDDGPSAYTGKLLNILDEYNVKVTFFVTNQFPAYQKYIKEAYARGHSIGIHTYSHNFSIYKSVDSYFSDFNKISDIIKKQTGVESRIVRFPGGSSNTVSRNYKRGIMTTLAGELESRGYSYFDWNLGSGDTDGLNTSAKVANRVIKNLNNQTKMVLMHDTKSYSVNAVRDIIEYGLANGYTFASININSPTFHHKINN